MHATQPVLTNERENSARQNPRKKGGITEIGLKTGTQPFMLHGGGGGVRSLPFLKNLLFFFLCRWEKNVCSPLLPPLPPSYSTVRYSTHTCLRASQEFNFRFRTHPTFPPSWKTPKRDIAPTDPSFPFRKDKREIETMYQIEKRGARNAKIAKIPFPCPNSFF